MRIMHLGVLAAILAFPFAHGDRAFGQATDIYPATLMELSAKTGEISTEELGRILADGSAIVIDGRPRAEFDAGHIPGARVIDAPGDEQVASVERIAKGDK